MSNSKKGGKPLGWDYWGKRKVGWCVDRKTSHKMERMQFKEQDRKYIDESLTEVYGLNIRLDSCPYYKSLFPNATSIEYYHHWVFGYEFNHKYTVSWCNHELLRIHNYEK